MAKKGKKSPEESCKNCHIAYCRIFPSIGIARVGNSTEYFIGPESPGPAKEPSNGYKDSEGRIKKQAARFRIYAFDESGKCCGELTSENSVISWKVELANKKAEWFAFSGTNNVQNILDKDIPIPGNPGRRNPKIAGSDRDKLCIAPAANEISGADEIGPDLKGQFLDHPDHISLGSCRTDNLGRLIVLPGDGKADCVRGKDAALSVIMISLSEKQLIGALFFVDYGKGITGE